MIMTRIIKRINEYIQLTISIIFFIFIVLISILLCLIISTKYEHFQFLDTNQQERWIHVEIEINIFIKEALNNFLYLINIFTWTITRFFYFFTWLFSFIF